MISRMRYRSEASPTSAEQATLAQLVELLICNQ